MTTIYDGMGSDHPATRNAASRCLGGLPPDAEKEANVVLRPTIGWFRVAVDTGWPPSWERSHCGTCEGDWIAIEYHAGREHPWRLKIGWRRAPESSREVNRFATAREAADWIHEPYRCRPCTH